MMPFITITPYKNMNKYISKAPPIPNAVAAPELLFSSSWLSKLIFVVLSFTFVSFILSMILWSIL